MGLKLLGLVLMLFAISTTAASANNPDMDVNFECYSCEITKYVQPGTTWVRLWCYGRQFGLGVGEFGHCNSPNIATQCSSGSTETACSCTNESKSPKPVKFKANTCNPPS